MAGIYIHIPFCKMKCGYCDFYSITNLRYKENFIKSLLNEISLRKNELKNVPIKTLYFGGGTPSLLSISDFKLIFEAIHSNYDADSIEEITIETNPDDVNKEFFIELNAIGFNRVSMGIQSFNNKILAFMNRRHSAQQAISAVDTIKNTGFTNMSIDLIYGVPDMSMEVWNDSIQKAINLDVQHISAYHLTFEPNTEFYKKLQNNELNEIDENDSLEQHKVLVKQLNNAGFDDYEISNFSKTSFESKHNSNYWSGLPYIGFGPSAHSFINNKRRWNDSNLLKYINNLGVNNTYFNEENLSEVDIYNETIMLGLRTKKGVQISKLDNFDTHIRTAFLKGKSPMLKSELLFEEDGYLKVNNKHRFLTDKLIADLFIV